MISTRIRLSQLALLLFWPITGWAAQEHQIAALLTTPLAGQVVSVLPFTRVIQDGLPPDALPATREGRLLWADSLLSDLLVERAPEVNWILPNELRRVARRNAPMVGDPDRLGTAILRGRNIKSIPDPLRSSLRSLVAVTGGRFAFIPASLILQPSDSGGVIATLVAVMADVRGNNLVWRTSAPGRGATPLEAVKAALATILPLELTERE